MKLLPAGNGRKVRFEMPAEPGSRVFVAGTFNNWDPGANALQHNPGSGLYRTAINLPAGRHEYKFVVDGRWTVDPRCPDCVQNPYGSTNSVVHA